LTKNRLISIKKDSATGIRFIKPQKAVLKLRYLKREVFRKGCGDSCI
jgi:hypothetical protein